MPNFTIGTRGSLLAVTQTTLIKSLIEKQSDVTFDIKTLKTQGDQITDKPLWQLDGKDFFTKELDQALLNGEIDLVVHSYKDLGSERPDGIELACVTKRTFAQDILLIKKERLQDYLKNPPTKFIVGTSSPRRIANINKHLKDYLPFKENYDIECSVLRGNVNTRIQKLLDDKYDAIVLALAGLERLASLESSHSELEKLLAPLNFMVMPLSAFPTAASQGALAIEVSKNARPELKEALSKVHHSLTKSCVDLEREAFQSFGGGCHLAVGLSAWEKNESIYLKLRGEHNDNQVDEMRSNKNIDAISGTTFVGLNKDDHGQFLYDKNFIKTELENVKESSGENLFFTSKYCLNALKKAKNVSSLWSSGIRTMKLLASHGHWINGSSDSLGHDQIQLFKTSKAIKIMLEGTNWSVLSHGDATSEIGPVIESYERKPTEIEKQRLEQLQNCANFYWTSYSQYEFYRSQIGESLHSARHFCGLGKTLDEFQSHGVNIEPIPMQLFREMVGLKNDNI